MAGRSQTFERTLRRVLRLIDISSDLQRNQDDSAFEGEGRRLIRIVDENVFEVFIRPFGHREAVETFYSQLWHPKGKLKDAWRSFEVQSAMITSEFIVTKLLGPGARDPIIMSEPHRWELANRIEDLASELRDDISATSSSMLNGSLNTLQQLGAFMGRRTQRSKIRDIDPSMEALQLDLSKLEAAGAAPELLDKIQVARVVCAVLANDRIVEPIDQLRRVATPPIRNRLRTLETLYPPSPDDLRQVEDDAAQWFRLLVAELDRPGHAFRERGQRRYSGRALWNDARTIAFTRWVVTNRLGRGERLVFITGDNLVFDAYRRWHSSITADSDIASEPFFMRRLSQFTPIFNPNDMGGGLRDALPAGGHSETLFSLIQQAVEAALLPFTLALTTKMGPASDDGVYGRRRELIALKAVDQEQLDQDEEIAAIADLLSPEWLAAQASRIDQIRVLWQEAQRLAIGSSYTLILSRLNDERLQFLRSLSEKAAGENDETLKDYVAGILNKLVDDSLDVWLPLASDFLRGSSVKSGGPRSNRVSLAFPRGHEAEASTVVSSDRRSDPVEDIFSSAACLALDLQDFNTAERFAGLAFRSNKGGATDEAVDPVTFDLRYLHAVSLKYILATVGVHLGSGPPRGPTSMSSVNRGIDRVKLIHGRASRLLNECLSAHFSGRQGPLGVIREAQALRYVRALSERASLNLFMAASLGLSKGAAANGDVMQDARRYVRIAKGDLFKCFSADDLTPDPDGVVIEMRKQYRHNVAAAEVLNFLLAADGEYSFDDSGVALLRSTDTIVNDLDDMHPLHAAEVSAYVILAGRRSKKEWTFPASSRLRAVKLPLDRAIVAEIVKEFPEIRGRRRQHSI